VVDDMVVFDNRMVMRGGNTIYQVAAISATNSTMPCWQSSCRCSTPQAGALQDLEGIDLVCEGTWKIYAGFEPLTPDARELIAVVSAPTLSMQRVVCEGYGTMQHPA